MSEVTGDQPASSADGSRAVSDAANRSERGELTSSADSAGGPPGKSLDYGDGDGGKAVGESVMHLTVEHAVAEGIAHVLGIAETAVTIALQVVDLESDTPGQVPREDGTVPGDPVTLPEVTIEGTPTLPEITIEGSPAVDVHDLPDAPPDADRLGGWPATSSPWPPCWTGATGVIADLERRRPGRPSRQPGYRFGVP